jgi:hypothetical protein
MRGNKETRLGREQREELEDKRSQECQDRKDKRRAKGKAEELAEAVRLSPAGKEAAETRKAKWMMVQTQEQANYKKTRSRASTRIGGRRKQLQAGERGKLEE